jgi:hypothetical protein
MAVKYKGCNAIDDDGDGYQDNCEEDKFPPEILLNGWVEAALSRNDDEIRIMEKSFQTTDAAREYLEGIVTVVDDCAATSNLSVDIVHDDSSGTCEETRFVATPVHSNGECGDSIGKSLTFLVKVDGSAPRLSCSFVPSSGDMSKSLVDATGTISAIAVGAGASLVNSLLQYSIEVSSAWSIPCPTPSIMRSRLLTGRFFLMLFPFVLQDNCAGIVDVDLFVHSNQFTEESAKIGLMRDSLSSEVDAFVAVEPRE